MSCSVFGSRCVKYRASSGKPPVPARLITTADIQLFDVFRMAAGTSQ
jgi:hypothetical protein